MVITLMKPVILYCFMLLSIHVFVMLYLRSHYAWPPN